MLRLGLLPDQIYPASEDAYQYVVRVLVMGVLLGLVLVLTRGPR